MLLKSASICLNRQLELHLSIRLRCSRSADRSSSVVDGSDFKAARHRITQHFGSRSNSGHTASCQCQAAPLSSCTATISFVIDHWKIFVSTRVSGLTIFASDKCIGGCANGGQPDDGIPSPSCQSIQRHFQTAAGASCVNDAEEVRGVGDVTRGCYFNCSGNLTWR